MKIHHITIENFRGIGQLDFEFTFPVTVFEGKNGAGKSSILDCLATLLSWYLARIRSPKGSGSHFSQTDIRMGENLTQANLKAKICDDRIVEWSLTTARTGSGASSQSQLRDLSATVARWIEQTNTSYGFEMDDTPDNSIAKHGLPLVVHYTVNRTVLDIQLQIRTAVDLESYLLAFEGALGVAVDFRAFFAWFRQREDLELEAQIDFFRNAEARGMSHPELFPEPSDPQLDAVRGAMEQFTGLSNLKICRSPLRMEVEKEGAILCVDHLSNGEKGLLAMVGDLARRLAILSGDENLVDPLQGCGVVLIDEIDLHLHPAWQREVIPKLVETFPNCQFIVSTHSPQVISDVHPEAVFLLRQKEGNVTLSHPEGSFGQTSDRILEDTMCVPARRQEIKDALRSVFDLISKNDLDAAKKQVITLQEKIGSDPDLVRASTLIHRKEVLGE